MRTTRHTVDGDTCIDHESPDLQRNVGNHRPSELDGGRRGEQEDTDRRDTVRSTMLLPIVMIRPPSPMCLCADRP
jgi:hypothetical protein